MIVVYDVAEDRPATDASLADWWHVDVPGTLFWAAPDLRMSVTLQLFRDASNGQPIGRNRTVRKSSLWAEEGA